MGGFTEGKQRQHRGVNLTVNLMNDHRVYCVGDHLFALDISQDLLSEKELMNYAPFRTVCCRDQEDLLFSLVAVSVDNISADAGNEIACFADENGSMALFSSPAGSLAVKLTTPEGKDCCFVEIERDYRHACAMICGTASERRYALDTALMLLYAFASAPHSTLLIHASVIESGAHGYIFLGKSGTGKSTHTRLWTENVTGASLLNDDNPIIRVTDGIPRVYGSPWSGKTPCYVNRSFPIGAIVRLHQAPQNSIAKLSGINAYAALIPSCSYMKWNHAMAQAIHDTVNRVVDCVPVLSLDCLPDREAAMLCKDAVCKTLACE